MIDQERLTVVRGALGMEKPALAPAAAKPAAKAGLAGLKRLLVLLGMGGAAGTGYMAGKERGAKDTAGVAQNIGLSRELGEPAEPFTLQEHQQFARHGLDPARLKFLSTLSRLRQGMNLERQLTGEALSGRLPASRPAAPGEALGEYA